MSRSWTNQRRVTLRLPPRAVVTRVVAKQAPAEVFGGAREHKVRSWRAQFVSTLGSVPLSPWYNSVPLVQSAWSTCNNPVQVFSPVCVAATTLFKYFYTVCGCNNLTQVLSPCVWLQQPYSIIFTHVCGCYNPIQVHSPCVWLQQRHSSTFTVCVAATTLFKYFHTACGCINTIQRRRTGSFV